MSFHVRASGHCRTKRGDRHDEREVRDEIANPRVHRHVVEQPDLSDDYAFHEEIRSGEDSSVRIDES